MPTFSHVRTYSKKLITDVYTITKSCCEDLQEANKEWKFCPFCGEKVVLAELVEKVEVEG